MRDTDLDWEKLARENAYWAVLTDDRFATMTPEKVREFFEIGEGTVSGFLSYMASAFSGPQPPFQTVIDFGCGVGRLLIPMARLAQQAYGVDVSKTMRETALKNAESFGLQNISCVSSAEELVKRSVKADWVSSHLVFQHIEPRRGYFIINDLLQCLAPGGVCTLHIPLFKTMKRKDYFNDRVMYFRNDAYFSETVFVDRDTYDHPDIQMYDYDANTILAIMNKNEMHHIHLIEERSDTGICCYTILGQRQPA